MDLIEKNGTFGGIAINIGSGNISIQQEIYHPPIGRLLRRSTLLHGVSCLDSEHAVSELLQSFD